MKYEKNHLEHLTDEQLDHFLTYQEAPFGRGEAERIQQRFAEKTSKPVAKKAWFSRRRRGAGIAFAALALLILTGFSYADSIQQMYQRYFGGDSGTDVQKLLESANTLSDEVVADGLRLKALSTLRDGGTTYFLAELTDETEDRLSEDMLIKDWHMLDGGNIRIMKYDKKSKTATLMVKAYDSQKQAHYGFILKSFLSHKKDFQEIKQLDLSKLVNQNPVWMENNPQAYSSAERKSVLKATGIDQEKQMKQALKMLEVNQVLSKKQHVQLSNIAYSDGLLHIQIKNPSDVKADERLFGLVHKDTEEAVPELFSYSVSQEGAKGESERFDCWEYVYNLPEAELDHYEVLLFGRDYQVYQKGQWAIQFSKSKAIPIKELKDVTLSKGTNQLKLTGITLSSLNFRFECPRVDEEEMNVPIKIVMNHGDVIERDIWLEEKSSHYNVELDYIPLEDVEEVYLGDQKLAFK